LRSHLVALLFFVLLTAVMTYPLVRQAWNHIENYGDPLLNAWTLAWDVHQLVRDPPHLFQANNFHPYADTLAYSENLLAIAAVAAPLLLLTGNPIWVHNLFLLLSFAFCGWTAYLLVYDQTRTWVGGLVAGIVYGFAHYRWGHSSHLQLLNAQWLPLVLLYLGRFVRRGCQLRDGMLAAGFFILQALSCTYYAFYTGIAGAVYLIHSLIARRLRLDWRLLRGGLAVGIALLLLMPIAFPYLRARAVVGGFGLEAQSGARLVAWISAAKDTFLGDVSPFNAFGKRSEHTFFPGIVALFLALSGLLYRRAGTLRRVQPDERFYVALIVLASVLALGPELRLIGGQGPVFEPLPYVFFYRLPGFAAMRVPARLGLLVMLGTAVLAGWGAAKLHHQAGRWGTGLGLAAIALMVVMYCPAPLRLRPIEAGRAVPAVYRWLAAQAPGSPIVELPSASSIWFLEDGISLERLARQQYFSAYHWQPMIMGYSGQYPPLYREHIAYLLRFPSDETLAYLRGLDVRYVVVHWRDLWGEQKDSLERSLHRSIETGQLLSAGWLEDDQIYELTAVEAQRPVFELHCPPTAPPHGPYYAYLLARTDDHRAAVSPVLTHIQFRAEWQDNIRGEGQPLGEKPEANLESGTLQSGTLPLTIGPGTMAIPLALSRPLSPDSTLEVEAHVLGQSLHARQTVHGPADVDPVVDAPLLEVDIPGLGGELWWAEQPYAQGLTLSHVALPRGREYTATDTIDLTLAWRNEVEEREHVPTASVQIFDPVGNKVAQRDMVLANALHRQQDWHAGQVVIDRHLLTLSPWLPPGSYEMRVRLYEPDEGRLLGPQIRVGPITVQRPPLDPRLIERRQWARLGDEIALLGYRLSEERVVPGDEVALTLFWEAIGRVSADYVVFTHLLGPQGIVAQADGQPGGRAWPTSGWRDGQVIEDRYEWHIAEETPAGEYPIEVGMYLLSTGERLPVYGQEGKRVEGDQVLLGALVVAPQAR
jgi:hypothetical protein